MNLTFSELRTAISKRTLEWEGQAGKQEDIEFRGLELGGEAGEALNVAKKYARTLRGMRGGITLEEASEKLREELADVVICADRIAELLGIDLGEAVAAKFNSTSEREGLSTFIGERRVAAKPATPKVDPIPESLKAFTRELLKEAYANGFDSMVPTEPIAQKLGITEVLYDENTESGLLWRFGPHGTGMIYVSHDGKFASACMDTRELLGHWVDYRG